MDGFLVLLQGLVVLAAILLGVRMGGLGLGLWGIAGTALLVFVLGLDPGSPPVAAFFIIIAVITASAAMQAAGGIDFLVSVASRVIRRYPSRITFVAPLVGFVFTLGAGTGNLFIALVPVIYETSYRNGIRPERPLAAATVPSSLGIIASPVSAAMAAYITLLPDGFGLPQILAITIPASIVACLVTSAVQQRIGAELVDDPEFLRRVESGALVPPPRVAAILAGRAGVPVVELAGVAVASNHEASSGRPTGDHHGSVALDGGYLAVSGQRTADRLCGHRPDGDNPIQPDADLALVHHPDAGVLGERREHGPARLSTALITALIVQTRSTSEDREPR